MFSRNTQNMTKNEAMIESIHKFDADLDEEIKENTEEAQSQNGSNGEQNEGQVSEIQSKGLKTRNFQKFEGYPMYNLNGHLDSVRDGKVITQLDQAITVSEDWTIRLWDLKNLDQEKKELTEDITYNFFSDQSEFAGDSHSFYSYYTLRGHTGIVTKLAIDNKQIDNHCQNPLFYTAGIEGIVRAWKLPWVEEVKQFESDAEFTTKLCQYVWDAHPNEIIWDLKHHNYDPLLLTASADGLISLWKTLETEEIEKLTEEEDEKIEERLFIRNFSLNLDEVSEGSSPICLDWLNMSKNNFIACYNNNIAALFDHSNSNPIYTFGYNEPNSGDPRLKQINTVICHPTMNVAISGSEDGNIGIFDLEAKGKWIRMTEKAHQGPISSIWINPNGLSFASSGSGGAIRFWDIRMNQLNENGTKMYAEISDIHTQKYGEGICALSMHDTLPILMSCGADSIVKLHTNIDM